MGVYIGVVCERLERVRAYSETTEPRDRGGSSYSVLFVEYIVSVVVVEVVEFVFFVKRVNLLAYCCVHRELCDPTIVFAFEIHLLRASSRRRAIPDYPIHY